MIFQIFLWNACKNYNIIFQIFLWNDISFWIFFKFLLIQFCQICKVVFSNSRVFIPSFSIPITIPSSNTFTIFPIFCSLLFKHLSSVAFFWHFIVKNSIEKKNYVLYSITMSMKSFLAKELSSTFFLNLDNSNSSSWNQNIVFSFFSNSKYSILIFSKNPKYSILIFLKIQLTAVHRPTSTL